jgi:Tol biopolymer transport system component
MKCSDQFNSVLAVALIGILGGGCADAPTAPHATLLRVSVNTTGGDLDDRYDVGIAGELHRPLGTTGSTLFNVAPGIVSVSLAGVADNCLVSGSNPRSVEVRSGDQAEVRFDVECATTGVAVKTRTVGPDNPEFFVLAVNQAETPIGTNDSTVISRLRPGLNTVALTLPGDNCRTAGADHVDVQVTNRAVTLVTFEITCIPTIRLEKIAFVEWGSLGPRIRLVRPDGSSNSRLRNGDTPSWSPDGAKLVLSTASCDFYYYYNTPFCTGGISLLDPETERTIDLGGASGGFAPAWAPTGDVIAFTSNEGTPQSRLLLVGIDGTTRVRLQVPPTVNAFFPAWFPDGQRLVFACTLGESDLDLCLINRDGSGFVRLTNGLKPRGRPAVSADGRTIAITRTDADNAGEIALMSADGADIRAITKGFDPSWSRDGTSLVFAGANGLFTINSDGSGLRRLTTGPHSAPVWRPGHE